MIIKNNLKRIQENALKQKSLYWKSIELLPGLITEILVPKKGTYEHVIEVPGVYFSMSPKGNYVITFLVKGDENSHESDLIKIHRRELLSKTYFVDRKKFRVIHRIFSEELGKQIEISFVLFIRKKSKFKEKRALKTDLINFFEKYINRGNVLMEYIQRGLKNQYLHLKKIVGSRLFLIEKLKVINE